MEICVSARISYRPRRPVTKQPKDQDCLICLLAFVADPVDNAVAVVTEQERAVLCKGGVHGRPQTSCWPAVKPTTKSCRMHTRRFYVMKVGDCLTAAAKTVDASERLALLKSAGPTCYSPIMFQGTSRMRASIGNRKRARVNPASATSLSCKKLKDQGARVLATRKPSVSNRTRTCRLKRTAARTSSLSLRQEPPRTIRKLGSPPWSQADPSVSAPS